MKHFHGTVRGSGNKSTNSGTMSSGLRVEAHAKAGSVVVQLHENGGVDYAHVRLATNPLTGNGTERVLYNGPISGKHVDEVVIRLPDRSARRRVAHQPAMLLLPAPPVDADGLDPMPEAGEEWFARARLRMPEDSVLVEDLGHVDTYDIAEVGEDWFRRAKLRLPEGYDAGTDHEPRQSVGKLTSLPEVDD